MQRGRVTESRAKQKGKVGTGWIESALGMC